MLAIGGQPGRDAASLAIATGLFERDDDGAIVRDNRTRVNGTLLMPGQRVQVRRDDPQVADLVATDRLQFVADLPAVDWWTAPGRILQCEPGEATPCALGPSPGALKVVMGTGFDPGACAYRLHTAVNEGSPHASAFVRHLTRTNNPHDTPTQYRLQDEPAMVRALLLDADVVHCHIDALLTRNVGFGARPRPGQTIVRHYHGTQFGSGEHGETPVPDAQQIPVKMAAQDDVDGYVLVGARLQLCALRPGRIHWLPIPVPVSRYAAMAERRRSLPFPRRPFRVAHSPTRRRLKGTDVFLRVCERLTSKGVPIAPVLIEGMTHADALHPKATCDATFDAFWLGMQGSGLEAAAMGQPVIAGDSHVADLYREHVGYVPYTFATDERALTEQLGRLATDADWYGAEVQRVHAYCHAYHDYAAVAQRYTAILHHAGAC